MNLHLEAARPELIVILRQLMSCPELDQFHLVGVTALALRFGHRISVDIDLFTSSDFDADGLAHRLIDDFHLTGVSQEKNSITGEISGIKIDCWAHR
jgi:hypothetical protein